MRFGIFLVLMGHISYIGSGRFCVYVLCNFDMLVQVIGECFCLLLSAGVWEGGI